MMKMKLFLVLASFVILAVIGCNNKVPPDNDQTPSKNNQPLTMTLISSTLSKEQGGEVHFYLSRELTTTEYTQGVTLQQKIMDTGDLTTPSLVGAEKVLPIAVPQEYVVSVAPVDMMYFSPGSAYIQIDTVDGKITMPFQIK